MNTLQIDINIQMALHTLNDIDCQFEVRARIRSGTAGTITDDAKLFMTIRKKYGALIELAKLNISEMRIKFGTPPIELNVLHLMSGLNKSMSVNDEIFARRVIKLHPKLLDEISIRDGVVSNTPTITAFVSGNLIATTFLACASGHYKCLTVRGGSKRDCPIKAITCTAKEPSHIIFIRSNCNYITENLIKETMLARNIEPLNNRNITYNTVVKPSDSVKINRFVNTSLRNRWLSSTCEADREGIADELNPATLALMIEFACSAEVPPEGLRYLCMDMVLEVVGWMIRPK